MASETQIGYSYEQIEVIAQHLLAQTKHRPLVGVICGSGIGGLADRLEDQDAFPYSEIPNFPISTVSGHKGKLIFGNLKGVPTVCMQGRFHFYEGYPMWKCTMPIRVMKLLGVQTLVVTNACGGLNENFKVGDIMLIKDHINFPAFAGQTPLKGMNDSRWGPRFPGLNNPYDLKLRNLARDVASDLGLASSTHDGVYAMYGGPSYETVAELRMLRFVGADAVGMSTAHEVVTAKHCGMRILGISLICNMCVMEFDAQIIPANHADVLEASRNRQKDLEDFISTIIGRIPSA